MLRQRLNDDLKAALKAKEARAVSTLRMILAALKDRDIAARVKGNTEGVADGEIIDMLQKLVAQRRDSIAMYEKGGRSDLVQQETEEIDVIQRYMPQGLSESEVADAVAAAVAAVGATTVKDMGTVMARLKEQFAGRMDFAKAGALVKQRLG
ncbi:MAG TPA: GatB/YqeY domain-containing protein [Dongiaceae bacterium]